MSDLQCPATLVVLPPQREAAVTGIADALRSARVAAVYAAVAGESGRTADRLAGLLGLPAGMTEARGDTAYTQVLADLSDLHRGETVAVVLPESAVAELRAGMDPGSPAEPGVEVTVDGDGWSVRNWGSSRPRAARWRE